MSYNYGYYSSDSIRAFQYALNRINPPTVYTAPTPGVPTPGTSPIPRACGGTSMVPVGSPGGIGGAPGMSLVSTSKSLTGGATMCASDMKADWWKYALAAAVGYFVAKKR
jgi:hypothetical protein